MVVDPELPPPPHALMHAIAARRIRPIQAADSYRVEARFLVARRNGNRRTGNKTIAGAAPGSVSVKTTVI